MTVIDYSQCQVNKWSIAIPAGTNPVGLSKSETGGGDAETSVAEPGRDPSLAAKGQQVKSCLREFSDTRLKKPREDLANLFVCLKHKGLNKNRRWGKRQKEKETGQSGFTEEREQCTGIVWVN